MARRNPNALADYWSGIHHALAGRLSSVAEYLRHPASGFNAENYFRDLLRAYLPRRYAVEAGFVVNVAGERSDFIDVLIVDCLHIPPLSAEPHFKVFPAEAVVGAIEITSAPKARVKRSGFPGQIGKLQDDILKLAKLRAMARDRQYITAIPARTDRGLATLLDVSYSYSLSPRSFLITCGDEWIKPGSYERNLMAALTAAVPHRAETWINAAFSMRHGLFHFRPDTRFEHSRIPIHDNALLEFIFFIYSSVSTFNTSQIDIQRYRPTVPTAVEERVNTMATRSRQRGRVEQN